jgi:hypothetical protein
MARRIVPVVIALLAAPLFAQKPAAPPPKPWANKLFLPDALTNPTQEPPPAVDHDFGTVPFGSVCTHTFTVSNIYDVPLQVIDIRAECGCLKAYPPNRVLQPFEQAEFTVTMNAGAFKGPLTKKLLVTFGPGYLSTAELRLTATSREDVSVTPGQLDFGIVQPGTRPTKTVTLKYTGRSRDWKITEFVTSGKALDVTMTETARGFLSTDYTVTATLKDTAPPGPLAETVTLKTTDPNAPAVKVAVVGTVLPPVSAVRDKVEFVAGRAGVTQVMVRAVADCTLTGVADDGDGVSVETFPTSRQLHVVTVRYEPKDATTIRKEVRLKTNLPGRPEAVIVVEAK